MWGSWSKWSPRLRVTDKQGRERQRADAASSLGEKIAPIHHGVGVAQPHLFIVNRSFCQDYRPMQTALVSV